MRFYVDEDLSDRVASIARDLGVDVISSHECGRNGLSDEEQLWLAAQEGRCLMTRNRDHFIRLTVHFFENQWPHAGILIVPRSFANRDAVGIAHALSDYGQTQESGLPANGIDYLRPARYR